MKTMDEVKPGSSNLPPAPPGGESPAQAPQPTAPSVPKAVPTQPVSPPPAPAPPPPATQPTTPPTQPLAPVPTVTKKPISKVLLIIAILLILILSLIAIAGGVYLYQLSSGVELISIPDSLKNLIPYF